MRINNMLTSPVNRLRFDCGHRSSQASFNRLLSDTQQESNTPAIFMYLPTKDTVDRKSVV